MSGAAVEAEGAVLWRVRHVTAYDYARDVEVASHLLHLSPRPVPGRQALLSHALSAEPAPGRARSGADHFGNPCAWWHLDRPHRRFVVTAESAVRVTAPPVPARSPPWEELAGPARERASVAEFLLPSPLLPSLEGARTWLAPHFPPGRPALEGLRDALSAFKRDLVFRPGATTVSTPVSEVLRRRAGVCQDFAHLMVTGLRMLGVPARYVSGYVRTRPPPGRPRRLGADQSHAWVAAWLGPEAGWVEADPTNDLLVAEEHVLLGWGRDFGDVSPLRGVILGGGRHAVRVSVDVLAEGEG